MFPASYGSELIPRHPCLCDLRSFPLLSYLLRAFPSGNTSDRQIPRKRPPRFLCKSSFVAFEFPSSPPGSFSTFGCLRQFPDFSSGMVQQFQSTPFSTLVPRCFTPPSSTSRAPLQSPSMDATPPPEIVSWRAMCYPVPFFACYP